MTPAAKAAGKFVCEKGVTGIFPDILSFFTKKERRNLSPP